MSWCTVVWGVKDKSLLEGRCGRLRTRALEEHLSQVAGGAASRSCVRGRISLTQGQCFSSEFPDPTVNCRQIEVRASQDPFRARLLLC